MKVKVINRSGFDLPVYETEGAAGFDIRAKLGGGIKLSHGDRILVPTGLFVSIPKGYELQVRPRSGLAIKKGISIVNSPGTVDSDYRGEIKVIMINLGYDDLYINPGDKIAQGVIAPVIQIEWEEVDNLDETERGDGGFGHTGK